MKTIMIDGVIGWDVSARDVQVALEQANGEDITVEISSPGGFVYPGIHIYNMLKNYPGQVHAHLMGLAASMSSLIAMAGDLITAESNSVFMIHNASLYAQGDYRTMQKAANISKGISNMLAKTYAARSGKDVAEIMRLMDEETYLFGDEAKSGGFVDEVTESKTKSTKEEAVAMAHASVMACRDIMKDNEKMTDDIEKLAAMIPSEKPQKGAAQHTAMRAGDDNSQKGVAKMDLQELMAKDPALNAQVEALKKGEFDSGTKAGMEKMQAKIKSTTAFLASDAYPAPIKSLALQVLNGEKDQAALDGAVTVYDAMKESMKQDDAAKEAGKLPETNGAQTTVSQDGAINNEADLESAVSRIKGM